MKFIELTENGSDRIKSIAIDKIKSLESLKYHSGTIVTIVTFIDGTELHAKEPISVIKSRLN